MHLKFKAHFLSTLFPSFRLCLFLFRRISNFSRWHFINFFIILKQSSSVFMKSVDEKFGEKAFFKMTLLEAYPRPFQISVMELFVKIFNGWKPSNILAKSSTSDVWQSPVYECDHYPALLVCYPSYFCKVCTACSLDLNIFL